MAESIIDGFEFIKVNHDNAERLAIALCLFTFYCCHLQKILPVIYSGQAVNLCHSFEHFTHYLHWENNQQLFYIDFRQAAYKSFLCIYKSLMFFCHICLQYDRFLISG